jgi:pilus assembly protein CpaE
MSLPDTTGTDQTTPAVAVAVVDMDPGNRDRLCAQLGQGATPFGSVEELEGRLTGVPVVIVLGPSQAGDQSLASVAAVLRAHPEVGALLVADELSTSVLQQALRSGVRDVLAAPADAAQLVEGIQRVAFDLAPPAPPPSSSAEGGGLTELDGEAGRVLAVFSTKGGAGKSVIATNVAVALAERCEKPVCLVDADLQFGDIAVMLKLAPEHTIVDAVSMLESLDANLLDSLLVTHTPSGLRVLPAPLEPAFADQIGADEVVRIVEELRKICAFIVVDTPAYFNEVVLGLIEVSDDVLLVAGMDIPNIKNVKIGLQTLRLLNTPMEKLRLVLNRANSKVKLEVPEVERTLQLKADALIPSDVVVPQSVNKGAPVVMTAPKSGVAKSLRQLAGQFIDEQAPKKRRKK